MLVQKCLDEKPVGPIQIIFKCKHALTVVTVHLLVEYSNQIIQLITLQQVCVIVVVMLFIILSL